MAKMKTGKKEAKAITADFSHSETGSQRLNAFATLLLGWMLIVMNFGCSQEANARPAPKIATQKPRSRYKIEFPLSVLSLVVQPTNSVYRKMLMNNRLLAATETLFPVLLHESVAKEV